MRYNCLSNVYCCTHCAFCDYCKADIKNCIIFRFEQILSSLNSEEFEIELFKLNFGLVDGLRYSYEELMEKYHISLLEVRDGIDRVVKHLRRREIREELKTMFRTVLSTDENTPYAMILKCVFYYRGTNSEFLKKFEEENEKSIKREELLKQKILSAEEILTEDLDFSIRARNSLERADIKTFNELKAIIEYDMPDIKKLGVIPIYEIKEEVERVNKLIDAISGKKLM